MATIVGNYRFSSAADLWIQPPSSGEFDNDHPTQPTVTFLWKPDMKTGLTGNFTLSAPQRLSESSGRLISNLLALDLKGDVGTPINSFSFVADFGSISLFGEHASGWNCTDAFVPNTLCTLSKPVRCDGPNKQFLTASYFIC